jgi:hypothetical protein
VAAGSWYGPDQEGGNLYGPGQPIVRPQTVAGDIAEQLEKLTGSDLARPPRIAASRHARDLSPGEQKSADFVVGMAHDENHRMLPPSQLEVVVFWIVGIVITILSGGVAIYASHHHLWG